MQGEAIEDQVVHRQIEAVVVGGEPHQARSDHRPPLELVWEPSVRCRDRCSLGLRIGAWFPAQVEHWQRERRRLLDHLHRLPVEHLEGGAPYLMATDELVEGKTEGLDVQWAVLSDADRLVVHGVVRREPAEVPERLLSGRERRDSGCHARHTGELTRCHAAGNSVVPRLMWPGPELPLA